MTSCLRGLDSFRVDLIRGSVEVAESVSDVGGRLILGPTKTYANRHVPLPPLLGSEIAAYLEEREADRDDFVFTAPLGGPLRHANFYKAQFKPAVRAAGLPEGLRFHDLRHTYAAFCIASTADPYAVMKRMGHSSITVTLDRYGHLMPGNEEEAAGMLEEYLTREVCR